MQGKNADLNHSKQGVNQATSKLPRLASRQYTSSDFSSGGRCLFVPHMVRYLRCLNLQVVTSVFITLLNGWQCVENPAALQSKQSGL